MCAFPPFCLNDNLKLFDLSSEFSVFVPDDPITSINYQAINKLWNIEPVPVNDTETLSLTGKNKNGPQTKRLVFWVN